MSHVLEHDAYLLWLAQLHACIFWFNPVAWWLKRRLAVLTDGTADDAALRAVGDRPGYAQVLLELASRDQLNRSTLAMSHASNVPARIERILGKTVISRPRRRILAFGAVLPVAVATAALQLADTPAAHAQPSAAGRVRIVSYGGLTELSKYYPAEALHAGIEGTVVLAVTLDTQGRATNTLTVSEQPADYGFGAAASTAAHTIVYDNPTRPTGAIHLHGHVCAQGHGRHQGGCRAGQVMD
jgi:TonB family protein